MSGTTDGVVDERARTWAFTALALGLAALLGGGTLAVGVQWLFLDQVQVSGGELSISLTLVAAPFLLSGASLWLARSATSSDDALARPVALAAQTVAVVALVGVGIVMLSSITSSQ